jgi:prevent-host-death family protein
MIFMSIARIIVAAMIRIRLAMKEYCEPIFSSKLSKIDRTSIFLRRNTSMRYVSATDAKQRLAALLDSAQREPVTIRRQKRDVAVILSAEEYDRMRNLNAVEFKQFCDRVAQGAKSRGMNARVLKKLLANER